ncbi:hypothetical protein ACHAXT_004940 [Thalassiosira profunda]
MINAKTQDDISESELERSIDRNKVQKANLCGVPTHTHYERALQAAAGDVKMGLQCHDVGEEEYVLTGEPPAKLDYFELHCFRQLVEVLGSDTLGNSTILHAIKSEYDLVVICLGVWEAIGNNECNPREPPLTGKNMMQRMEFLLDRLNDLSATELQFVFRTTGFHKEDSTDRHWKLIRGAVGYFEAPDVGNMTLVDWGSVISDRSFPPNRIEGDLAAHYGLEARLLFIQQLMHELVKAEL